MNKWFWLDSLIFNAVIVRFFGYGTLLIFYKLTGKSIEELQRLKEVAKYENANTDDGSVMALVGGFVFVLTIVAAYLLYRFLV